MEKLLNNSNIWDLHIHSCKCPKSSGEFQKMKVNEFVDHLLEIFKGHPDLSLISFTDHNHFSYEVYKEFYSRNSPIELVPGIEIDVKLPDVTDSKHLIFYFNIPREELEDFSEEINKYLFGNDSFEINDLLNFLISKQYEFIISPHAFKQGKRAINFDWNDEAKTNENAHKFLDQFFCFWETSGYSEIAKAIEFLNEFNKDGEISIISFSDSSNSSKLKKYLDCPPQYFKSLPNFKGIQLAGTDDSRILKTQKKLDLSNSGNIIGCIQINDQKIQLSDELNVIVGGRGSGKSLLLDNIALNIDNSVREYSKLKDNRIKFLDTIPIKLYNIDNSEIALDSKKIDYFDQAYVSKIFNSNDISKEIESYFQDEFNGIDDINVNELKLSIIENFNKALNYKKISKPNDNISNLVEKYKVINENEGCLKFNKRQIKKKNEIDFDLEEFFKKVRKLKCFPKELTDNKEINNAFCNLLETINEEVSKYNKKIARDNIDFSIKNKCTAYSESKNNSIKEKNEQEELFVRHLKYECNKYEERADIVNALIQLHNEITECNVCSTEKNGLDGNIFRFEKRITFEKPLEYFRKLCLNYMGTSINKWNMNELFKKFIFDLENNLLPSKNIDDFIDDLKSLKHYEIKYTCDILHGENTDSLESINTLSPGTQTNILMEYIVSKDTKIPLLIDQPEDNIDNETIYKKLTTWFRNLKSKRQVIVVTHDANIVVNADAENVIIANKDLSNQFVYDYGALEYGNILNRISNILDGGVEAVERRLKKYGREKNNS